MTVRTKKVAYYGIFLCFCILMGWLERLIVLPLPVPGIKLGLANAAILVLLYHDGIKPAVGINFLRIVLVNLMFGGLSGFIYAFFGAFLAMAIEIPLSRIKRLGVAGVSVAAASVHIVGQLFAAQLMTASKAVWAYLPWLLIAAVLTGLLTGAIAAATLRYLPKAKL
ncbi:MAG TPA: Gx transporter family protein [Oscillospiraceae bacterium]|nr:Gx transporter family protein [Oscillospiraceae bacterium]HPF57079.1 Gx transporter family protein [Clostridiales bacterium]HPK36060.1 Gx transporter family protein [Oscillospiraceae bacterium]HPR75991.1 Gx transporter family protein [Oscillospiraceae bacterium]